MAYLLAGITFKQLLKLFRRNSISLSAACSGKMLFLLHGSLWSSFFARLEYFRYNKKLEAISPPDDPVFIIGHWRTGSTFLHQLMHLDPSLITPTLFQVVIPEGFMVAYPFYRPFMKRFIPTKRPMDNVRLGMDEPQEDEYALFRMTTHSPLEYLIFPRKEKYFLDQNQGFVLPGEEQFEWEQKLLLFFKMLTFKTGKIIISKNPFHSFRIPILVKLFPKAKFIHIIRHPEDIVPSTINMFDIIQRQNIMNHRHHCPQPEEVISFLDKTWTTIRNDRKLIPSDRFLEIKYESLIAEPLLTIEHLYQYFGFPLSEPVRSAIVRFLEELKDYKKNEYAITPAVRNLIRERLKHHYQLFEYK
jgi:hypothetical protein